MKTSRLLTFFLPAAISAGLVQARAADSADLVQTAKDYVKSATAKVDKWEGPTSGPKAESGKSIVYVAADLRNGGIKGVADGVAEAAQAIGWKSRVVDGRGEVQGRGQALGQAIALRPQGIILGGFDVKEQRGLIDQASQSGIVIVGWHAAPQPGPAAALKLFTNVTTPVEEVAKAAAYLAIAVTEGRPNAVIFTDSAYTIALAKSTAMAEALKQCSTANILETRVQSLGSASRDMAQVTASLLQHYGKKWNCSLGINDLYFDGMVSSLTAAGIKPEALYNISAGDGSTSAYQRIRAGQFQYATIPEPLTLHGWQLVDELNRAFAKQSPSGFNQPVHIVTKENVTYDGGAKSVFDPDNAYRQRYQSIWGK